MDRSSHRKVAVHENPAIETGVKTLIIGDIDRWSASGRQTASFDQFAFTSFTALDAELLRSFDPQIILSPLVSDSFDVLDIAERLQALGFTGCYRVIAVQAAFLDVVHEDVARTAPDLNFDILEVGAPPR